MFADWSCTVLVHNRTCCGKYLCNSLISDFMFRFKSAVSVAFVYKQPMYINTATENELIVYYGIWCILGTKFSYAYLTRKVP